MAMVAPIATMMLVTNAPVTAPANGTPMPTSSTTLACSTAPANNKGNAMSPPPRMAFFIDDPFFNDREAASPRCMRNRTPSLLPYGTNNPANVLLDVMNFAMDTMCLLFHTATMSYALMSSNNANVHHTSRIGTSSTAMPAYMSISATL